LNTPNSARCDWVSDDPDVLAYHDLEWGVPLYDDHRLLEMLILEGAQAGLSWITVLRKRLAYREAFEQFDPAVVARFDSEKIETLMKNPGIIRNRRKLTAAVMNAQHILAMQATYGSFAEYLWGAVGGKPIQNSWTKLSEVPDQTQLSRVISRDLYRRGLRFVGPTIIYAYMQAVGLVNDHLVSCFRYAQLQSDR
jgi:DNA-3-methyladenine glycosylase I